MTACVVAVRLRALGARRRPGPRLAIATVTGIAVFVLVCARSAPELRGRPRAAATSPGRITRRRARHLACGVRRARAMIHEYARPRVRQRLLGGRGGALVARAPAQSAQRADRPCARWLGSGNHAPSILITSGRHGSRSERSLQRPTPSGGGRGGRRAPRRSTHGRCALDPVTSEGLWHSRRA